MSMLVFESDRFRPYLPDECQVNPNVLGFELAEWLSRELAVRGTVTSYPNYEDWGWFLEGDENGLEYMICCSGGAEADGRFEWRVFITHHKKLFGKRPDESVKEQLLERIRRVIEDASIRTTVEEDA